MNKNERLSLTTKTTLSTSKHSFSELFRSFLLLFFMDTTHSERGDKHLYSVVNYANTLAFISQLSCDLLNLIKLISFWKITL